VLAAGAGSRFGMPKALARRRDGTPWIRHATEVLLEGGCSEVVVVLGARAADAFAQVPASAWTVVAADWSSGQAASLRAGLTACAAGDAGAALISLVDLPDLTPDAVRRVADDADPHALRRATYGGVPGHPVLIGRQHWASLAAGLGGDSGAAAYLQANGVVPVDCTELGGGADVDEVPA
jgi:CTP:molybdopterin cytidylyltransferase MocA